MWQIIGILINSPSTPNILATIHALNTISLKKYGGFSGISSSQRWTDWERSKSTISSYLMPLIRSLTSGQPFIHLALLCTTAYGKVDHLGEVITSTWWYLGDVTSYFLLAWYVHKGLIHQTFRENIAKGATDPRVEFYQGNFFRSYHKFLHQV